jgi:hypothetical protein
VLTPDRVVVTRLDHVVTKILLDIFAPLNVWTLAQASRKVKLSPGDSPSSNAPESLIKDMQKSSIMIPMPNQSLWERLSKGFADAAPSRIATAMPPLTGT